MDCQCQETEALLRDYAAGRLTQSDRQRVELIIEDCDQCAETLTHLQQSTAKSISQPENEETNTALSLGQILTVGGLCTIYGGGIYLWLDGMLHSDEIPWAMKIGLPALFIGIGILLTSVLIQRIKAAKNDPYKDVEK